MPQTETKYMHLYFARNRQLRIKQQNTEKYTGSERHSAANNIYTYSIRLDLHTYRTVPMAVHAEERIYTQ